MKKFIKYVFATITGMVIVAGMIILIFFGVVASMSQKKEVKINKNSMLHLELNYSLKDRTEEDIFDIIDAFKMDFEKPIGLTELMDQIDYASTDVNIKGIFLDLSHLDAGFAKIYDLRNALLRFRETGKFIVAYSDFYTNKTYYLASAADHVFLNPKGNFFFKGMMADVTFIKDALEKIGIEIQPIKKGNYKGAVEPFVMDSLSLYNKEQINAYLHSIYDEFVVNIAETRNMDAQEIDRIADDMLVRNPEDAKEYGLVDDLLYRDEVYALMNKDMGRLKDTKIHLIAPGKYARTIPVKGESEGEIAVVYAEGQIVNGHGKKSEIGAETYAAALREIRLNDDIKAVVLRINSGGGSALASEIIWREADLLRQTKPLIVSMGDVAASGGYYIACAADTILALPNSITGSIGVFGLYPNLDKLLENIGVHVEIIGTGNHSDFGRIDRQLSESDFAIIDTLIGDVYHNFLERVSQGRSMTVKEVDHIAQGRVWTGTMAREIGLIDEFGGFQDALHIAAAKANLKSYELISYPKHKDKLSAIIDIIDAEQTKQNFLRSELGQSYRYYELLKIATELNGVQALMPYTIRIQ